jgi:phosphoribosylformylglycinamidine synthase
LDDPAQFRAFFEVIQSLIKSGKILAYHDRSYGGLFATVSEMCFASATGVEIDLDGIFALTGASGNFEKLFSEELGAVVQIRRSDEAKVREAFFEAKIANTFYPLGSLRSDERVIVRAEGREILNESRVDLRRAWSKVSFEMQKLRDNPKCAHEEYDQILDTHDLGILPFVGFDLDERVHRAVIESVSVRPRVAILREQGVNGQVEMARAFEAAGFAPVDVHMSDLQQQRVSLSGFSGLVACGGFSYGDVLGAGLGWAKSILFNQTVRDELSQFFARPTTFTLGVCNGCQALSGLKELIPGAEHFPSFIRNESEQFEARLCQVEVLKSPSVLLKHMTGSRIPVAVAHGEGRALFSDVSSVSKVRAALRFVDTNGKPAVTYPKNPNGSPGGLTGICSDDGRVTLMMPHPERVFRTVQHSWAPPEWGERGPWMRMFESARLFVG